MTMPPEAESTAQQGQSGPLPDNSADRFIEILNNRSDHERGRTDRPIRQQGFVVLARDGFDLWPLQARCGKKYQTWNDCLTARYRLRPGAIFGTLLTTFLVDLQKIGQDRTDDLAGVFFPGAADVAVAWQNFLLRKSRGSVDEDVPSLLEEMKRLTPEQLQGDLTKEQLEGVLRLLSSEELLPRGKRLVIFAEVDDHEPDADEQEWEMAETMLFDRLPKRVGLVFSGAPASFKLEDTPHFLELSLSSLTIEEPPPPSDPRFSFTQGSLLSDLPADIDTLGVKSDAEALASFVLHPQTEPPLTIGIHGPWGKGKSSFMKLVEDALIEKVLEDRDARSDPELSRLRKEIVQTELELKDAPEAKIAQLRSLLRTKSDDYDERRTRLAERDMLTVQFNAWRFEDANQIWAGLASVISERLERALPWYQHMWMRIEYAWKERRSDLLLNVGLPLLVGLVILLYLVFGGFEQFKSWLNNPGTGELVLRDVLALLLPFGSLVFLIWFISKQILSVVQPLSLRVLSYIQLPTYREQMGYQFRVMEDLDFVYRRLKQHQGPEIKVVVFIDDLDRCSEEKIIEVLQAINLILGDSRFFVFLGMDTEMIYRAIHVHYSNDQTDEALPSDLPEEYLHKIIQVSFYLPETSKELRQAYLDSLFSETARKVIAPPIMDGVLPGSDRDGKQPPPPAPDGSLPFNFSYIRHPPPVEVEDTVEELEAFKDHLGFLKDNPREVKRLINLHRLVKIILTVKQQLLLSREEEQRKLVRWLIFCARWPELIDECVAVADELPDSPNVLATLLDKLKQEHPGQAKVEGLDQTRVPPSSLHSLEDFAKFDGPDSLLSAQDIKSFKLVAQISTLVRESVAPRRRSDPGLAGSSLAPEKNQKHHLKAQTE
jgi:hypothetical protein